MNVNQLELGDPTCNDRMYVARSIQPTDELAHENRHVADRRRRVDRLAGRRVDDIVLDTPVLPRRGGPATDAGNQMPVISLSVIGPPSFRYVLTNSKRCGS